MSFKKSKKFLITERLVSSISERLKDNFRELTSRDFRQKVGREILGLLRKFQATVKILRPNERRVIIILSIVIIICAVILFRNYYLSRTTLNPQKGGVYIEGVVGSPKYINPLLARSEIDRSISKIIFLPLIEYNAKGELAPVLAQEFKIIDDGRRYDFILEDNISWQDGVSITTDDVIFTLNMLQSEEYEGPFSRSFDGVKLEKITDTEFSLILPETNSSFTSILSEVGILPEHKLHEVKAELLDKNDFNFNPVGSGRYRFEPKESKQNGKGEAVLKRTDTYKKDSEGYFEKIIFRSYSSMPELVEAYKKGEINGFGGFNSAEAVAINRQTFRCFRLQIPRFTAIFLNLNKDNLKELKFRQALARAVDKEKIVKEVYGGEAEPLKTIIPSFAPGYDDTAQDYPYHLPTSSAYLDELKYIDSDNDGIREKDGQKLELKVYTTDDPSLQKMTELVSADWQAAGVGTKVVVIDLVSLQKTIIPSHNYDAIILGENLGYPPDPYPYFHSSQIENGLNISAYKNLAVDSLLEDERLSIDQSVRTEKLKSFSRIMAEDLPAIPLISAPYLYGANISVKGIPKVRIAQNSSDRFLEIGSWYIKSERKRK